MIRQTQTELFNVLLILLSLLVAVSIPFHLFLWAYAVLGPLHYLTELFWLKEKDFFLPQKKSALILLGFTLVCVTLFWCAENASFRKHPVFQEYGTAIISGIFFMALCTAAVFVLLKEQRYRIIMWLSCLALCAGLSYNQTYLFVFGTLTATLIHVSLFTLLFMIQSAVKNKAAMAFTGVLTYTLCVGYICYRPAVKQSQPLSKQLYETYAASGFHLVNYSIAAFLKKAAVPYNLVSDISLRIQTFIAFAYTYHYLNWFSKVNIIHWNKVPRLHMTMTLVVWLLAVALYAYDFKTGFMALLILSLAHVFMEFPLNVLSIKNLLRPSQQ